MLELIKKRCGIASAITVYNEDIVMYIQDCIEDMIASGVPPEHCGISRPPGSIDSSFPVCKSLSWK